ncbi:MAG: ParB/RepB/Spo0J family partition protein [Ilumatobacteraceae bacterium]|nr:ParB/RepB/Spo0J family partition protein [Ilumatobacteraceae bacterium]
MARNQRQGRGLSSLIPGGMDEVFGRSDDAPALRDIPLQSIRPNPHQPRRLFDEDGLQELAASITQIGVLQPILVRPADNGYELIAGERRWRAAGIAALEVIPAIVRTTDDMSSMEQALVENLHRADLTPLEEAAAYHQLIEDFGFTHEQVAERVGKSRSAISNALRLMALPTEIQQYLGDGRLTARHARSLLSIDDTETQLRFAHEAVSNELTVRELEALISGQSSQQPVTQPPQPADGAGLVEGTRLREAGVIEVEEALARWLDTRVRVSLGASKGRIAIDFADLDDLRRIHRIVFGGEHSSAS